MTDRPTTDRTPGDDAEREIAALRAELRAGGLLPDLPAAHEPTEASAEAMLRRVLASRIPLVDEPLATLRTAAADDDSLADGMAPADAAAPAAPTDEVARARARLTARQAADARRRRATVTRTLFGLAATVLVGAVVVVPMVSQSRGEGAGDAGVAAEAGYEGIQRMGEVLEDGLDGGISPHDLDDLPLAGVGPLVGVVVDLDGCLAVREDETGTVYIPVDAPGSPGTTVRDELRVGARVSVHPAVGIDVTAQTDPPPGCDAAAGPFWPAPW